MVAVDIVVRSSSYHTNPSRSLTSTRHLLDPLPPPTGDQKGSFLWVPERKATKRPHFVTKTVRARNGCPPFVRRFVATFGFCFRVRVHEGSLCSNLFKYVTQTSRAAVSGSHLGQPSRTAISGHHLGQACGASISDRHFGHPSRAAILGEYDYDYDYDYDND